LHNPLPQKSENINKEKITVWKSRPLHGRHAYELEEPDDITASKHG
jgi:hypothetical protein